MAAGQSSVVIIDDSDQLRRLVRSRLERSGMFDVVADGRDGTEAIGLAFQHQPTLLLLDTSMPTMDGLEALPGILTVAPDTKVVIYTGFEERRLASVAKELGAADFIEKSYPIDQLPARLTRVIGSLPEPRPPAARMVAAHSRPAPVDHDQEVLSEHLERFREIFDVATIGMATLTLNGSVVRANRALASLLRCEPHELVGLDYGQVTCGNGELLDTCLEAIQQGQDLATFEHEIAGYSETRIARATVSPVRDPDGIALYAFLQVQDITAQRAAEDRLRRSEERFRLLVSAVEEYAIFMLDTQGHVISWNAGAERINGYRAEEIIGQHFRIFYPAEQQHIKHPETELQIALKRGAYAEEGWRIRKDGSRFWSSVVITPVFDDAGNHVGFAKVTRDQTERRMAEQQRERAIEQQNRLLAVTGHELGTPTAVIDGALDTVLHGQDLGPDERDHLLAGVRASTRRLKQLSADLLTASRLDAETLTLHPVSITLDSLLSGAAERARIANPAIDISVSGDLDATMAADPVRLAQAVDNLITNSVRHGRPPIQVSGVVVPGGPGDEQVLITVSDTGPGVDPELRDRLFDRFAAGRRTGGAGLGLYIVRELARMHGGDVGYEPPDESRPSRFVLALPRAA